MRVGACVALCPSTLRVAHLLHEDLRCCLVLYIWGKALGVNQCKYKGEIFLSCRVGIFYRLKVDQFFNTIQERKLYTHEIYIYICMIINTGTLLSAPSPALLPPMHRPAGLQLWVQIATRHFTQTQTPHLHTDPVSSAGDSQAE